MPLERRAGEETPCVSFCPSKSLVEVLRPLEGLGRARKVSARLILAFIYEE